MSVPPSGDWWLLSQRLVYITLPCTLYHNASAAIYWGEPKSHKEKGANSMATSGLILRSDLVSIGRVISILFGINGVRKKRSHLVGPPFPEFKDRFSATAGWHFSRDLTRRLLIGGCGHSHVSLKYG